MPDREVVIRISAKNLSKAEFDKARKQLDDLGKKAGLVNKDVSGLGKGFQKAANDLASFNPTAARATSLLGGFGAAGIAAGIGIGAVAAAVGFAVSSLVEMGDRLTNLSRVTGITTDALQRMEGFGRPLGISLEQISSASTKLEKSLGEGGKGVTAALKKLGLSMADLAGMDADKRLFTVAEALSRLNSPLDQASAGAALLGRAWADLRLDSKSIDEGKKSLEGLIIVSNDALKAGDNLGDAWGKLWANMKASAAEGSSGIVKALDSVVDSMSDLLEARAKAAAAQRTETSILEEQERLMRGAPGAAPWSGLSPSAAREQAEENIRITNFVAETQRKADEKRIADLKKIQAGQRELTDEEQREVDKLAKLHEKAAAEQIKEIARLSEAHAKAAGEAWIFWDAAYAKMAAETEATAVRIRDANAKAAAEAWEFWDEAAQKIEQSRLEADIDSATNAFGAGGFSGDEADREKRALRLTAAQNAYDESLRRGADVMQLFGDMADSEFGQIVGATFQADAAMKQFELGLEQIDSGDWFGGIISGISGVIGAFQALNKATAGGGVKGTLGGALAGAKIGSSIGTMILPGIGTGIGAAVGAIGGAIAGILRTGPNIVRDAARDLGATIAQEMADAIKKSGKPIQLAVGQIFEAGGFESVDRFAEEIGDIFSGLSRGEFGKPEAIAALEEAVPMLIANLQELGPAGEEQIQRIISAAQSMGVEFEGLSELIQGTFAPDTMESIAASFGITNDQVRELSDLLGVQVQTDLERMASSVGLSVAEFEALGAAVKDKFGIPMDQIDELMASLGVGAGELAAALGVDVAAGAGGLTAETAAANVELGAGVGLSAQLAFNLERAAAASGGIHIGSFDAGGGIPTTGALHGFHGDVMGPRAFVIERGVRERVDIGESGSGKGGASLTLSGITINVNGAQNTDRIVREIGDKLAVELRKRGTLLHGAITDVAAGRS